MDDSNKRLTKRRNKFAGKENVSRETTDSILSGQIDQLREIARTSGEAAAKLQESVNVLYNRQIPLNTEKFEQLNRYFIAEMENKLRKVKQPSKVLKWYIAMWVITLISAFLAGYFIHERQQWKEKAAYWYNEFQTLTIPKK